MAFDRDTLESIFDATRGTCHRCGRALELPRYGQRGAADGWEIDAARPQPKSTLLLPACIPCLPAATPRPRRRDEVRT
jgi:hypothetical protein